MISPNGDGVNDTVTFSFALAQNVPVRRRDRAGRLRRRDAVPGAARRRAARDRLGRDDERCSALPDGAYVALVTVTDALGDVQLSLPLTIDTIPPVLTLLDAQTLRFSLSEPATVTVRRQPEDAARQERAEGHVHASATRARSTGLTAVAQDAAGNVGPAVTG